MHPPVLPMPGSLKAVRVIIAVRVVLAVIVYGVATLGLAAASGDRRLQAALEAEAGMSYGAVVLFMVIGAAIVAFEGYVLVTMGRGGSRTQTLLRLLVGIGLVNSVLNLLMGQNAVLGIVLLVVVAILVEGRSAKEWFHTTESSVG
ncbi:hypothetical protein KIK06_25475 [Nocardiopsis sp. EMB25]|uniref:hypothetical protein n=1 Tax=Nocardiopsis sp. EMB25 TaxID=2835867 RepID=UPI0022852ED8|nr:hypothetical protein [Nocardiopsis sp. EMB25]MCY9787237.1 hypothetical protein [Nocardiopsis sp. EMB25]